MLTRHLLHLSNQEMVCVPWRFGQPLAEHRFAADAAGLAAFRTYLTDWRNVPAYLAVDLIEEDFRIETLPHLRWLDRRTLVKRRLGQIYRNTPFRLAMLQGRETTGRRDDIMLCTAITQSEGLSSWLDVIGECRIPLLGIYPTALLGEQLLRALGQPAGPVLTVTPLGHGAVRISFFQQGRLKFSRISEPGGQGYVDEVDRFREEARKTLQYVAAQSWYERGQTPATLVIAPTVLTERIRLRWLAEDASAQVVTPGELALRLRLPTPGAGASATAILLQLLMQRRPPAQLAPRERVRDGRLWYVRTALFALSGLAGAAAIVLALLDLHQGMQVRDQQHMLQDQLAGDRQQIEQLQSSLPASTTPPDLMSATVRFQQNEVLHRPRLQDLLPVLADSLARQPAIELHRLSWLVTTTPPAAIVSPLRDNGTGTAGSAAQDTLLLNGATPRTFFVDARIEAEVRGGADHHEAALAEVEQLVRQLGAPTRQVQLLVPPFDASPKHALAGDALAPGRRPATFILRMIERHAPPAP